ncbi:MAG: hypothetical protein OIF58_16950, partial [Cohaesibacter sp.]|nr:hypothetical protein [Cohaesibacter sp.]
TSNHDPWNIQPKACALQMLEWFKEATKGTIASKRMKRNTNEYIMYFNHVQSSRRFCRVTCTLPSYQSNVFRNFLLPVSSEPLRIKRFYH